MAEGLTRRARRGAAVLAIATVGCGASPLPAPTVEATPAPAARPTGAPDPASSGPPATDATPLPSATAPRATAPPPPPPPAPLPRDAGRADRIRRLVVPGGGPVLVSEGAPESDGVLLYLHGRCGDPEAFRAFVAAVPPSLTLLSVQGDVKCKSSDRARWSSWAPTVDALLRSVVAGVSARRQVPLRERGWLVMGYSEGALRAEALLARFPDRYVAGVLAGGPRAPRRGSLSRAHRVVLMAGSRDARLHLIEAVDDLTREGARVRFDLLPEARHGEYGPEGERVVGEALRWLLEAPGLQDRTADLADVE